MLWLLEGGSQRIGWAGPVWPPSLLCHITLHSPSATLKLVFLWNVRTTQWPGRGVLRSSRSRAFKQSSCLLVHVASQSKIASKVSLSTRVRDQGSVCSLEPCALQHETEWALLVLGITLRLYFVAFLGCYCWAKNHGMEFKRIRNHQIGMYHFTQSTF